MQTSADNEPDCNPDNHGPIQDGPDEVLVVSGVIDAATSRYAAIDVRRGMTIVSGEGREVGQVAAVIVDRRSRRVTYLVLGRLTNIPEYKRMPLEVIEQVAADRILLRIGHAAVDRLPLWHG